MDELARWQDDEAAARPERFGPEEWRLRLQLALCYRIFARLGWTELIYNHITLRLPGAEPHFLINPFGLLYEEVTASNLVRIDLAGRPIGEGAARVNPAGFVLHGAIHSALPAAHCIMHVHTTAGMAVASSEGGLSMSNFYAAQLRGQVGYHDFEGITLHEEEKARIVASLGGRHCLILRNHGLLALGETVAQAFAFLWTLNR
ncbi:MAG: class II aldolase/adducin family protein, partial [Alphaproteobacteria bacterium]|nr:class II aldolase/adducin family protein [Alphaproteobacteria bacterium]